MDNIAVWTSRRTRQIVALLMCFFLASCAPALTVPLTPDPLDSRWGKFGGKYQTETALSAMADIDLITFSGRRHLRVALLLQRPMLIRMESIPVFGPPDFFLSLNRENLKIFLPGKKDFYQGRPSRESLSHFLPISLSPTDLVHVLLGHPPPPPAANGGKIGYRESREGEKKRLDLFLNNRIIRTLWSDVHVEHVTDMEITDTDAEFTYRVRYGKYLRLEERDFPQQVTIVSNDGDAQLIVHYDDMELASMDEATFDLPIPEGITPASLDRDETLRN